MRLNIVLVTVAMGFWVVCIVPVLAQGVFPGVGDKNAWLKANGFFAEGNQLMHGNKLTDAIAKYKQAIDLYPSEFQYHYNLALALKKNNDSAGAIVEFKQAIALNRASWKAWKGLANTYFKAGQFADARVAFQQALASNPPAKEIPEIKKGVSFCSARAK